MLVRLGTRERTRLMQRMGRPGGADLSVYPRGVLVLFRAPAIFIGPLLAHLAATLLTALMGMGGATGGMATLNFGIAGLLIRIIYGIGIGVAIIAADIAWRRGKVRMEEVWRDTQRKLGDLIWAVLGFGFVVYVATLLGGYIGIGLLLAAAATIFAIYTLPAAAIGGTPGVAALNASFERVRSQPIPAVILGLVYMLFTYLVPYVIALSALPLLYRAVPQLGVSDIVLSLIEAVIVAVCDAYVAVVLARVYDDRSTGRFYR